MKLTSEIKYLLVGFLSLALSLPSANASPKWFLAGSEIYGIKVVADSIPNNRKQDIPEVSKKQVNNNQKGKGNIKEVPKARPMPKPAVVKPEVIKPKVKPIKIIKPKIGPKG